jgi:hypothetical protein
MILCHPNVSAYLPASLTCLDRQLGLIASVVSNLRLRVKGPDKQVQNVFARIPSVKFLIAEYFSHLLVFLHKNLGLRRESLMLLEYHKKK